MEITAELKGQGIYLGGENLQCMITFRNKDPDLDGGRVENVAWASAQIQSLCQYVESSNKRKISESEGGGGLTSKAVGKFGGVSNHQFVTSLQPGGDASQHEVASTKPKILFCDLYLNPGEERSFLYEETLPRNSPSTYHGRHVRYTHRIVVATQRVNCAIATLRIPFRVIAIQGDSDAVDHNGDEELVEDEEEPTPRITNPFFVDDKETPKGPFLLEPTNPRRMATFYDIRNATGRVGKLCLFRSWYRLGEDIIGLFDFADAPVRCMQYLVSLLCEEKVIPPEGGGSLVPAHVANVTTQQPIKLLAKQNSQEFCFGYEQTNFKITVPLHATPSFNLKACQLTWMLKFEFVICSDEKALWEQPFLDDDGEDEDNALGHEWNGPQTIPVETLTWTLPVTILPNHPTLVGQSVQMTTKFNMNM